MVELLLLFDSTPQFNAMLDEVYQKFRWKKNMRCFAVFTNKDKKIISSTNEKID